MHSAFLTAIPYLLSSFALSEISSDTENEKPVLQLSTPIDISKINNKLINEEWRYGGTTKVTKSFIRLINTKDDDECGWIWSAKELQSNTLAMVVQFRIYGSGEKWRGKGLTFWLTEGSYYSYGTNYGYSSHYHGLGVIISTGSSKDTGESQQSVILQTNKNAKGDPVEHVLCEIPFRFDESKASFSAVHSTSRISIKVDGKHVTVQVDPESDGRFKACGEHTMDLEPDWLQKATFGITGASGTKPTDKYDILDIHAFTDPANPKLHTLDTNIIVTKMSKGYEQWLDTRSCGIDCSIAVMRKCISNFHLDANHRLTELKDNIFETLTRLTKLDDENAAELVQLERKVTSELGEKLDASHQQLGLEVKTKIDEEWKTNAALQDHGWRHLFLVFSCMLIAVAVFVYRKYRSLTKIHLM